MTTEEIAGAIAATAETVDIMRTVDVVIVVRDVKTGQISVGARMRNPTEKPFGVLHELLSAARTSRKISPALTRARRAS